MKRSFRPIAAGTFCMHKKYRAIVLRQGENGPTISETGMVRLMLDFVIRTVDKREMRIPRSGVRPFRPMRLWLPYGVWHEKEGSKVLFSRDYCPLWRILPSGDIKDVNPWERIEHCQEEWFYDDSDPPWHNEKCRKYIYERLAQYGIDISDSPRLMTVFPMLVEGRARDILGAVKSMAPEGADVSHLDPM